VVVGLHAKDNTYTRYHLSVQRIYNSFSGRGDHDMHAPHNQYWTQEGFQLTHNTVCTHPGFEKVYNSTHRCRTERVKIQLLLVTGKMWWCLQKECR
jgi:hypothetical protein